MADAVAWGLNVASSVCIVFVNKNLMAKTGDAFVFPTTLCSLHFFTSGIAVRMSERLGFLDRASLPLKGEQQLQSQPGACAAMP